MSRLISYRPLRELVLARLREFYREPEVIFWVYGFPVIIAIGLGIAFRSMPSRDVRAGVIDGDGAPAALEVLAKAGVTAEICSEETGRTRLASGKIDVLVRLAGGARVYVFDPTRSDSVIARERVDDALQRAEGRQDLLTVAEETVTEPGSRYIDFLMPGLMGMNLVGGGLYGVGFVIVDMRVRKLLKRFLATPMRRSDFFTAILASRMLFMIPEMLFLFGVAVLGFGVPFRGSVLSLTVVAVLSAFCFAGLGLLIATRARKLETVSGLINLVVLPMWLLSGIFFSTDRFPDVMQPFIQVLPLTATNDALRAIILDGESIWTQTGELGILLVWTAVSFLLSLRLFRWT